jgi:hypothetical protein
MLARLALHRLQFTLEIVEPALELVPRRLQLTPLLLVLVG